MLHTHRPVFWTFLLLILVSFGCSEDGTSGTGIDPNKPFGGANSNTNGTGTGQFPGSDAGTKPADLLGDAGVTEGGTGGETPSVGQLDFQLEVGDDGEFCAGEPTCFVAVSFNSDRDLTVQYSRDGAPV